MLLVVLVVCVLLFVILPVVGVALWTLLSTLLVGLLIGALGRLVVPGQQRMGCLTTSLVGVAGGLLGTLAAHSLHVHTLGRWLLEVGAAAALVLVVRPRRKTLT